MKNTRTGQRTIRKLLKGAGSAILLATLFVLVFAGTLSGAFGIEENLQQNGIIESNVADAATYNATLGPIGSSTLSAPNTNNMTLYQNTTEDFGKNSKDGHDQYMVRKAAFSSSDVIKDVNGIYVGSTFGGHTTHTANYNTKLGYETLGINVMAGYNNYDARIIRLTIPVVIAASTPNYVNFSITLTSGITSFNGANASTSNVNLTINYGSASTKLNATSLTFGKANYSNSTIKSETVKTALNLSNVATNSNGTKSITLVLEATVDKDDASGYKDASDHMILAGNMVIADPFEGMGTAESPFLLRNRNDFDMFSILQRDGVTFANQYFKVQPDNSNSQNGYIDMLGGNANYGAYTPGGLYDSTGHGSFRGHLDGNNVEIRNLVISVGTDTARAALIGTAGDGAVISNVHIASGSSVSSLRSDAAGVVGFVSGNVTVSGCVNDATIYSPMQNGGIVANVSTGGNLTITNCQNNGTISGYKLCGGIVGYVQKTATVTGCVNNSSGKVYCSIDAGGIVGYAKPSTSITGCTNNGTVSADVPSYVPYSIVRYDAHVPNSEEGVRNMISDRNQESKYCTSKNGAMSFVIEVPDGVSIAKFAIRNANDTSGNTGRAPKEVYIWGSNTRPSLGDKTDKGKAFGLDPSAAGQDGWTSVYENSNIGLGSTNYYRKEYSFSQTQHYKYYWIRIAGTDGAIQFSEFEVLSGKGNDIGGIVGYADGTSTSNNVVVDSAINNGNVIGADNVGGIVGGGLYTSITTSATNSGKITGISAVGGIAGSFDGTVSNNSTLSNTAVITGSGNYVGGIFGSWTNQDVITGATFEAYGTFSGASYVGGIAGYLNTNGNEISAMFKTGVGSAGMEGEVVAMTGLYGGGFFGFAKGNSTIEFGNGSVTTDQIDAYESNKAPSRLTGAVVGGAVGANIDLTLDFTNCTSAPIQNTFILRSAQTVAIGSDTYENATMSGGIVGYNGGTIKGSASIYMVESQYIFCTTVANYLGGAVGYNAGIIENCRVFYTNSVGGLYNNGINYVNVKYVGGLVGYNAGSMSGMFANNIARVDGKDYVGGFIGYNAYVDGDGNGITIDGYTNNSQVTGTNYVGGIVGSTDATLTIKNSNNNATITGYGYVGGILGECNGASVTIIGCHNSGEVNITGGNVGGILGYANGNCKIDIKNCYNDGLVKSTGTAGNVGGIVGRAYTSSTDASAIKIFNCYNIGEVSNANSDSVGGIVGYARSESAGVLVVKYCYNKAKISGETYIGGIVGSIYTGKYATIENCYTTVDGTYTITATGTNDKTAGAIIGGAYGGQHVTGNFNVINSWGFYSNATVLGGHNTGMDRFGAYVLVEGFGKQVYPIIDNAADTDWTKIIGKNITSFYIESGISVANGYYLALLKENHGEGASVAKSFATPNNIGNLTITANTDGSTAFGIITYSANVAVNANQRNIRIYEEKIEYTAPDTEYTGPNSEFDKQGKAGKYIWNLQNSQTKLRNGYLATFDVNNGDDVNVTAGGYTFNCKITADGVSPEKIFGQIVNEKGATIVARKLTVNFNLLYETLLIGEGNNIYRNDAFGLEQLTISRVLDYGSFGNVITLNANNAMSGFSYSYQGEQVFTAVGTFSATNIGEYDYTITINSTNYEFEYPVGTFVKSMSWSYKIIPYDLASHYSQGKVWFGANTDMVVTNNAFDYVPLNNGNTIAYYPLNRGQGATPQALVYQNENYKKENFIIYVQYSNGNVEKISLNDCYTLYDLAQAGTEHVNTGASVTASGEGNFTSTVTKYYVVLDSDFGWSKNTEGAGTWGTQDNPFVISTQAQLMRLSQILNGDKAWNSINSDNQNVVLAKDTRSVATDKTYSGAYFVVTNDIHLDGTFKPVGNADIPFKAKSFASNTDGTLVTISYFYNDTTTDYVYRDYVGLFGNAEGTHFKDLLVWGGTYNGGTSYTGKQIIGQDYVGGLVGKMVGGIVENCTFTSNVGGASIIGQDYVGGLIGNAEGTQVLYDTSDANMRNNDNLVNARVTGVNYVGGIIGQWIITSASQFNNGNANGLYFATTANNIVTSTGSYAGAIAGALDASGCADNLEIKARLNVIAKKATKTTVHGVNYVGALYGSFIGGGTDKTTVTYNDTDVWATIEFGGRVVGGFIGYLQDATLKFNKDYNIDNKSVVFVASSGKTPSFFGGVVGVLGKGANIAGTVLDENNKTFHRITNSVAFGKNYKYGDFVGGIVGYVSSGAGRSNMGSTIFGDDLVFVGQGEIHATNYVGGIFGAIGIIDGYTTDDTLLFNTIRYGSTTNVSNANIVTFKPSSAKNIGGIYGTNNVGGLVGGVFKKALIYLENAVTNADNPTFDVSNGANVYGTQYVGGIVGYLEQESHVLNRVVNTGVIGATNASYVGGLVGYMIGGTISNSVSASSKTAPDETTNLYLGSKYVGGLVGFMQGGSLENSLSTGFKFDGNNTSITKGGVVGDKLSPIIEGSWTIYIATAPTYSTVSLNKNGKYVLIDESVVSEVGSFAYLLAMAGITTQTTYIDYIFKQGELLIGVEYPTKANFGEVSDTATQPEQLAFYDVSGSDAVMTSPTTVLQGESGVVRIGVNFAAGESFSVCKVEVKFNNIKKYVSSNNADGSDINGRENAAAGYQAPSGASENYRAEVTTALYDNDGNITRIIANIYFKDIIIGSVEGIVGNYDSGTLTPGDSETTALTISNKYEWNDFAWQIYTGQNDYKGKYVKLLADITIERKASHTGTNGASYNFDSECDWDTKSRDRGWDVKNAVSNKGYNFAGNIALGADGMSVVTVADVDYTNITKVTPSFKGHFDGNGHKITVNYDGIDSGITDNNPKYQHRVSAFPNAGDSNIKDSNNSKQTSFKNLTVNGTIIAGTMNGTLDTYVECTNGAYDIAGFVGKPYGAIKFENCTNDANIQGLRAIAGIAGCSTDTAPITAIGCVNKGDITTYQMSTWERTGTQNMGNQKNYEYGTGGIVAYATSSVTIESCLNTGNITGGVKVGGLVGRVTNGSRSKSILRINNCANIGKIKSFEYNYYNNNYSSGDKTYRAANVWARVGGLVGEVDCYTQMFMYSSYNAGEVVALGSVAGGLVGIIGSIPDGKKPEQAETVYQSEIAYCYNVGNVTVGYKNKDYGFGGIKWIPLFGSGTNWNGTEAAGILGVTGYVKIDYCYNAGDITGYGCIGSELAWQTHLGGIVAEVTVNTNNSFGQGKSQATAEINNCYNTGLIATKEDENGNKGNCRYSADIVGYIDSKSDKITANNCYGIAKNILLGKDTYYSNGWNENEKGSGTGAKIDYVRTGTTLANLAQLTAVMKNNSSLSVGTIQSLASTWNANATTIGAQNNANYQTGSLNGYIYLPGCLPQLAVFAVDTYNGLSMNSKNYGYDDNYGGYRSQNAGDKYSPYVIRDGIDLLGLQALVDLGYTFEGKYVEFANGTNNITLDDKMSSDTALIINMPTDGSTSRPSATAAYKFSSKSNADISVEDDWKTGKSYHLFALGGVLKQDNNTTTNTYNTWKASNYAYGTNGTLAANAAFDKQNFLPIGRKGSSSTYRFRGHISGAQKNGVTEIINLRISYKGYAGLFGYVQDAEVRSVGASGTVIAYASSTSGYSIVGGIVAAAYGSSVIDGCEAGSDSRTLEVYAYGTSQTYSDSGISNITTSAGGIVGLVDTAKSGLYYDGTTLTVKNNKVVNAKVRSAKNNIGGIVGFVYGSSNAKSRNNRVEIASNLVQNADISAISFNTALTEVGTRTGGILGYSNKNISIIVRECVVGTDSAPNTVTIQGENSIGGIVGETPDAVNEIIGCKVLKSATIKRASNWGVVTNADESGTAIGGIVGLTYNASGTDPITTTFSGNIVFKGKIVIAVGTNYISASNSANDGVVRNVGGIVGDMGAGARIATGSEITVRGTIEISASTNANHANRNIGGVAGRTNDVAFSGKFDVAPTITAKTAYQVGGFIGKNNGIVNILADDTDIRIGGNISASHDVGGFIGYNAERHTLLIGADQYRAVNYNGALLINIVQSVTDAEKKADINTLISASGDNVGGIVGNSEQNGVVKIVKGTIVNVGQVMGQDNVGGIIGINNGTLSTGGSVYDATLEIVNEGKVNGNDFVGGVIGKLNIGQIVGRFINRGNVSGRNYVGGSIGYVAKEASILSASAGKTEFINEAVAIAGQSDALVASDATTADDSKFNVTGNNYVGGSIGLLLGRSLGNEEYKVEFRSKGTVNGDKYVGGSIGVLAGRTEYTDFISEGEMTGVGATTAVGGSVGFIGVPNPLIENDTVTEADIVVSHTHFEANGTLTLNDTNGKPEDVGEYVWGGIGGAIGAIGNATDNLFDNSLNNRWTNNTYYASGNVTAKGFFHVGGIVGLIKADNITIENMLAYDTKVTGGKNVGGIVGATIGENTVIDSAYSISTNAGGGIFTATITGGAAGGIIGYAESGKGTDASTSYWVKGYSNAELAGSSVSRLQTTLGRYTLALETFIQDGKTVTVVFTKELIGTGATATDASTSDDTSGDTTGGDATGDEELVAIYPTPYAYYESVGTHTVKTYDAKTQKYVDVTYTIDPEEVTAKGYTLIEEGLTWQGYFDMTFGTVKVGTVERSRITYQNDVGAWVEEKSSWTEYSTGTKQTGWYFVYANDQQGGNNQIGTISAEHTDSTADGYSDLWYWKRIANAYTMDERNAGYDDDGKANSPYAQNPLKSLIVREITKGETADTVSTVPHKGTLYATATAANFKTNPSASGYYMYIASSGNTKPTSVNHDGKFFIQAEGGVSQNVAVYYRSIAMGSALTYNGYERYAPITLQNDITYNSGSTNDPLITNGTVDINRKNKYFYNTQNVEAETKEYGTYHSTVSVYYFDDEGKAYAVGGIDNGVWRINKRKLSFTQTGMDTHYTYGEKYETGDGENGGIRTTLTVENIVAPDQSSFNFEISITAGDSKNTELATIRWTSSNGNPIVTITENTTQISVSTPYWTEVKNSKSESDKKYTVGNASNGKAYGATFVVTYKMAKTYNVKISKISDTKNYQFDTKTHTLTVQRRSLALSLSPSGVQFDNADHVATWTIGGTSGKEGIISTDSVYTVLSQFAPKVYAVLGDADKGDTVVPYSLDWTNVYDDKNSAIEIKDSSNVVIAKFEVEGNTIKVSLAKNVGTYYIEFGAPSDNCNYKFGSNDSTSYTSPVFKISNNTLQVKWTTDKSAGSHTYDAQTYGKIIATIKATYAINDYQNFILAYFNQYKDGKKLADNAKVKATVSGQTATIVFTTSSFEYGTYSAGLGYSGSVQEVNCRVEYENGTTKDDVCTMSYKINRATITLSFEGMTGANVLGTYPNYTYNTRQQGLSAIVVNGLYSTDASNVYLNVTGVTASPSNGKLTNGKLSVTLASNNFIDANTYSASVSLKTGTNTGATRNYVLSGSTSTSWTISPKELSISGLTGGNVDYDATAHYPTINMTGSGISGTDKTGVFKYGNDTIVVNYSITGSDAGVFVNAGQYKIKVADSNTITATRNNQPVPSTNYKVINKPDNEVTFTINSAKVEIIWIDITEHMFVYNRSAQGLTIASLKFTANGSSVTKNISNGKFAGYGTDKLTVATSGKQTNAGSGYTMKYESHSLEANTANSGIAPIKENYLFTGGRESGKFNIDKSILNIARTSGSITKVYNATGTVPQDQLDGLSFGITSTNKGDHSLGSSAFNITATYLNINVGTNIGIRISYSLKSTYDTNYSYESASEDVSIGTITPATITVTLDRLRNGRATRTFAEDKNGNISVYYGGANGAINGQKSNRSQTYRLGEGFTISGFPSAETTGVVKVLAKYVEVGTDRSAFNGYVNYVYDSGNGVYVKGTANGQYVKDRNLYKALEFSIEDVNDSGKAANYNFKVVDTAGDSITGDTEAQLGTVGKAIRVYDANDQKNENVGKQAIAIEITVKTYKIKYGNTTQSYANSDGSYNKEWLPVEAIDLPTGIQVEVKNGWMYDESGQPHKIYKQYTVIRGRANSTELSASVSGSNGKQLNYNMTNQPVLTIGYFVETSDETFEIGSLSSLLIASYYWWVSANSGNPEFNQVINTTVTWNALISDADYSSDNPPAFVVPSGAPVPPTDVTTWDKYFEWLETDEGGKHIVFLNENENNTWGYYTTTTGAGDVKKYSSFKQVRDINGTFTQSDIEMLNGFFRVYDVTSETYITKEWGKGGEFITNFLKVGEGNVAVAIGSIFKSLENGFTGAYDGGGYVIEYFNIMSFDGAENVGMFDVLGITANVKNLHLRNFTINAGAGNVGGIAGKALAGENAIENVSWHGTISMSGDGNVGGLIGVSARSINKAIALGSINAKGGNIGGLIGSIEQSASVAISNAVSFVYVEATGNVGAITASSSGATIDNAFYLASSAWTRSSGTLAVSDGSLGTAKTYTQLMQGSVSGYSVSGSEYYRYAGTKLGGDFDMLDDFNYSEQTTENIQKMNARQSLRLKDIVDVYMLMYDVKETNVTVDSKTIKVYTISSSSWLVGNKHGVDGDEIEIGNRQQVALLRELRFASFVLTSDVVATATSGGDYAYGGAFFGKVTVVDGKSYKIDFGSGKRAFEALATGSDVPYKQNV